MASTILNYFGYRSPESADESEKYALRALPSAWYTSKEMYELERRAIFSRKWQLITHKARLRETGDWLKYEITGFQFVLCRDREGKINGFHNVCRHRAFPVVLEDEGSSKIFSCKYHGWSYALNGKLAKAPDYQELEGFSKDANGLFPIHVHVDTNDFIWVNLDGKQKPEVAWEDDFAGIDTQERFKQFHFDEYEFDHIWQMNGDYNWKILADNYNECYHCPTTHPDIPTIADLKSYSVSTKDGLIVHNAATTDEQRKSGLTVASTYFFPNASTNVSPHFFMIQRFLPHGPTNATMRYEVYRNRNSSEEDFQFVNQMYKRIMSEDKFLCNQAQNNLNAGVFVNGEMHPRMEKGPLHFQKVVRDNVMGHYKRERDMKQEVWPARQTLPSTAVVSQKDIDFCAALACPANQEGLVW